MNQGRESIFSLSNILVAILVLIALATSVLWYKSTTNETKMTALSKEIERLQVEKKDYAESTRTLSTDDISTEVTTSNIDVKTQLEKQKTNIEKAIQHTYGMTKTQQAYSELQQTISPLVGDDFSDKLVVLGKPVVSEAGILFPFERLKSVKVFFGNYDLGSKKADCYVLVNYESTVNATTTGVEAAGKQTTISGQDFFILDYDLENDSLNYADYQRNINNRNINNSEGGE
ncbi:hypothetical protein [Listeria booriae]|uniref:Uncharacterized protein n=1 Tax=Listeria booriae TaxID=1552123 RepID=A0A842EVX7_9LIST|nr:hypothetical protein [Listeria booriae]MBC2242227.1 hypothetical protein [Listeria booriae]